MDDKTFDQTTAQTWIDAIEKPGQTQRDKDIYPRLNTWLNVYGAKHVLDLGCGQGICSQKLLGYKTYEGVDPSPYLIARANERYTGENITFTEGNAYDLPQQDGAFDGVCSVMVFHLLEDLEQAAAELGRVLQKGGSFCLITTNPEAMEQWAAFYENCNIDGKRLSGTMDLDGKPSEDVLYFHTIEDYQSALKANGLNMYGADMFRPATDTDNRKENTPLLMLIAGVKL